MTSKLFSILLVLAFAVAPAAYADGADEATITVVDEGDTPDDVVKVIELPDRASQNAAAKAALGPGANSTFGQEVSEEARNKDLKDQVKAEARQAGNSDARNDNAGGKGHGPH